MTRVNEYRESKNLPTLVDPREGLVGDAEQDNRVSANWIHITEVLDFVKQYIDKRAELKAHLAYLSEFPSVQTRSTVFIFEYSHHGFVLLFNPNDVNAYIADGGNLHSDEQILMSKLATLGKTITPVKYVHPIRMDFCGSAAALLAIHLTKCYRDNQYADCKPSSSLRTLVEKKFHRFLGGRRNPVPVHQLAWSRHRVCLKCKGNFKI